MRRIDRLATEQYGIPSILLMENAGRGIAELVLREYPDCKKVLVLCGKGNNGGDGFVAARHLFNHGLKVHIILAADPDALSKDAGTNYRIVTHLGITVTTIRDGDDFHRKITSISAHDLIIDALLGIGITSDVREPLKTIIDWTNRNGNPVVAVDIPSGLESDTGEILGDAIKADRTATLGRPKNGLFQNDGPKYSGTVDVLNISLPPVLLDS